MVLGVIIKQKEIYFFNFSNCIVEKDTVTSKQLKATSLN